MKIIERKIRCECGNDQLIYRGDYHFPSYTNSIEVILECDYCSDSIWHTVPEYFPIEQIEMYLDSKGIEIIERNKHT